MSLPLQAPNAEVISRRVYKHARAIVDRADPTGETLADAQAICTAIEEHGRKLDREADRIGSRAAESAARMIEDCLRDYEVGPEGDSRGDGMRQVLDELDRLGLTDEIAGVTPLDDVCRRLRREAT